MKLRKVAPVLALLIPASGWGCATCLCGDPTLTTMGTEKPFAGRLRGAVDYLSRSETVGVAGEDAMKVDEQRLTYSLNYAPTRDWMVGIAVPMVTKQAERYDLSSWQASGVGDTDVSARWFAGRDRGFAPNHLWGMQFGLRLPTSAKAHTGDETIDFDAQPGAGAVIPSVGVWQGIYRLPWMFYTSLSVAHAATEGYDAYQAGNVALFTQTLQYAVSKRVSVQMGVDARWKAHDHYAGIKDPDSGGTLVMTNPGVVWTPVNDTLVTLNYQHAVIEHPFGEQQEGDVVRVGVVHDF